MTQTKEEILEANYQEFYDATQPGHRYPLWVADEPYVHKAMDLYAEQLTRQKDERIAELERCLSGFYNGLKLETLDSMPVKRSAYIATQMAKARKLLK
jgi:hypothetical protein